MPYREKYSIEASAALPSATARSPISLPPVLEPVGDLSHGEAGHLGQGLLLVRGGVPVHLETNRHYVQAFLDHWPPVNRPPKQLVPVQLVSPILRRLVTSNDLSRRLRERLHPSYIDLT